MSSTAARLSLTSPTSAYLAVHFSNDRPHETSVATVRKNSRRFIASVLCFPCKDSASRTQNQIFRFCTDRSPQGRRRPGKTDGGRAENSPRRRPPRLPPTGIYAGKDNLSRTISASFGPALPARRKKTGTAEPFRARTFYAYGGWFSSCTTGRQRILSSQPGNPSLSGCLQLPAAICGS